MILLEGFLTYSTLVSTLLVLGNSYNLILTNRYNISLHRCYRDSTGEPSDMLTSRAIPTYGVRSIFIPDFPHRKFMFMHR